ncbi:hypothetical protein [Paraburkholderia sp. BR14312]|uniref:hypothetical protein n=1 Tax=unclassified Paraburkholderia TaxID=2615204 RepID=UPI0034CD3421
MARERSAGTCRSRPRERLHHPTLGLIALEQSAFSVDGRPDLHMIAYQPVDAGQAERIKALIEQS